MNESKINPSNREALKNSAVAPINPSSSSAPAVSEKKKVANLLESLKPQLERCLPKHITPERIIRVVQSCVSKNPDLLRCSQTSFLGAVFATAELGLEPGNALGLTYLIPFRNKGKLECQFQIGYKGYLELLYRSGRVESVNPHIIRKKDKWELVRGLEEKFSHEPNLEADPDDADNQVIFYAVLIKFKDGGHAFDFMTPKQVRAHGKKFSKSFGSNYSPWKTAFDMMALKTIIKRMMKYQRLSIEQQSAMSIDEGIPKLHAQDIPQITNGDDLHDALDIEFTSPNLIEGSDEDEKKGSDDTESAPYDEGLEGRE